MDLIKNSSYDGVFNLSFVDAWSEMFPYMSVISWYKGYIDKERLVNSLRKIVEAEPILGGRLKKKYLLKSKIFIECNPQKGGVGFVEYDLKDKKIDFDDFTCTETYMENIFGLPRKSGNAINKDIPLVYLVLGEYDNGFGITLIVNHCLCDGATYFKLLEILSLAYKNPDYVNDYKPLFTYNKKNVTDFVRNFKNKIGFINGLKFHFFKKIYKVSLYLRRTKNLSLLRVFLDVNDLQRIKNQFKDCYSINDALFEFTCESSLNQYGYLTNIRERNEGIDERYFGNAQLFIFNKTESKDRYMLKHYSLRNAMEKFTYNYSIYYMFKQSYAISDLLAGVQYMPIFETNPIRQQFFSFTNTENPLEKRLGFFWNGYIVLKPNEKIFEVVYLNNKFEIERLEEKFTNVGVQNIIKYNWLRNR